MAKKKRKPDKNERQPRDLPDRRAMEGMMQQLVAGLHGQANQDTPLGKAQAIMYRAFVEPNEKKRLQLAKDALSICPDCADAYNLLAEHSPSRKETRRLYGQGVAAGERALGPEAFQRDIGHFWGILDTRPYMRARLGLAHGLWSAGRREEAVQHLQDMLRLNPGDNQGVRYTLAGFLLFLDRDDDLAQLLLQYDEPSATWTYTKTLLAFRKHGDTPEAQQLLAQAKKTNKHVPHFLTGEKYPPASQPDHYSPGDENEALNYIGSFLAAWKSTAGAIAWLRASFGKKKQPAQQPKGPLGFIKKWLNKNLPQEHDVWQADFEQMPNWIKIAGEMVRPWTVLVTSRSGDLVLGHQMSDAVPPSTAVGCAGAGDAETGGRNTAPAQGIAGGGR
jgi:tetratricopeptide (TPR) repeat protein